MEAGPGAAPVEAGAGGPVRPCVLGPKALLP